MRVHRTAAATALLLLAGGAVVAQEMMVPNPEFADWAKFKKGTSTTLKITSTAGGQTSETVVTTTLVEAGADKLVLETSATTKTAGMEFKAPPMKREVTKTIPLPPGAKKEDFAGGKPPGTVEEGTETVKVAGGQYKAKWYKTKVDMMGVKADSKFWTSEEVPGKILKGETTTTAPVNATTKMELIDVKKPK